MTTNQVRALTVAIPLALVVILIWLSMRPTAEDKRIAERTAEDAASHSASRALAARRAHPLTTAEAKCVSLRHRPIGDLSENDLRQIQTCKAQGLWEVSE
jgi:hypothetical protein